MRAAIFIDGGYLLKQLQEARVTPDYRKMVSYLLEPLRRSTSLDLMRCYFYYCPPWMSHTPTEDEKRRMAQYERFVTEVEDIERWEFREGKLEKRREGDRDVYSQKRVDVLLSVDMVRHAAAGHIQHAVLVAGDSDFIPAVIAAKESGVTLTLWCGRDKSPHRDLMVEADDVQLLDFNRFPRLAKSQESSSPDVGKVETASTEVQEAKPIRSARATGSAKRSTRLTIKEKLPQIDASASRGEGIALETSNLTSGRHEDAQAAQQSVKKKSRRGRRGGRGRKKPASDAGGPESSTSTDADD